MKTLDSKPSSVLLLICVVTSLDLEIAAGRWALTGFGSSTEQDDSTNSNMNQ